jgi:nucleotide-binding universal stress UspA family protein
MKTVVAAVDFSPISRIVLAVAAEFARPLDARLILLHVVPNPVAMVADQLTATELAALVAGRKKDAVRHLGELINGLKGVPVEPLASTGVPAAEILAVAREQSADFIVMGSRGHTPLYQMVVGSTAHDVLRKAVCPVLIAPAPRRPAAPRRKNSQAQKS